ncbi:hypothetical protein BOH72_17500 [Mycobacterium sp. WY10]|nr:hypothetical protein BOH72_17500 [Mycobacterium sp. WY10]
MVGEIFGKAAEIFDRRTVLVAGVPVAVFWFGLAALAGTVVGYARIQHGFEGLALVAKTFVAAGVVPWIVLCALMVSSLEGVIFRLYAGHWKIPLLTARRLRHYSAVREVLVKKTTSKELADRERAAYSEQLQRCFPMTGLPGDLRSTYLGNILRAAETYPAVRYGMDAAFWWPRLIAVLPETARSDVSSARAALALLQNISLLAASFALLTVVAWIGLVTALPGGFGVFLVAAVGAIVVMIVALVSARWPARLYGDLLRSDFDVFRSTLLVQLGYVRPDSLSEERVFWKSLRELLYQGYTDPPGQKVLKASRDRFIRIPLSVDLDAIAQTSAAVGHAARRLAVAMWVLATFTGILILTTGALVVVTVLQP